MRSDFRPPKSLQAPLSANYNALLNFKIPSGFTYSETDNYVPGENIVESYQAILHSSNKPLEDAFYGTDNKGEWIRGRLTNPLVFANYITHLSELEIVFVTTGETRTGVLYLPHQNPYCADRLGQKFDILVNLV